MKQTAVTVWQTLAIDQFSEEETDESYFSIRYHRYHLAKGFDTMIPDTNFQAALLFHLIALIYFYLTTFDKSKLVE